MFNKTVLILVLLAVECSRSMLSTALGLPSLEIQKTLSHAFYNDNSMIMTRVEILSNAITFLISVPLVLLNAKQKVLTYKTRLMLLPALGSILNLTSLIYLSNNIKTVTPLLTYTLLILPALTGESFLFETCISDIAAGIEADKQQRVTLFLWVKGSKIFGFCFVQILLPLVGVTEHFMLQCVAPSSCALIVVFSFLLVFIESRCDDDDDGNDDERGKSSESVRLRLTNIEATTNAKNETRIDETTTTTAPASALLLLLRNFSIYHVLLCLVVTLHSAQRGEYKFTYFFLSKHLMFDAVHLRIINGCQYLLFSISLYVMGFIVRLSKHSNITLTAFVVSMLFSTCARVCQIVAWELTRFDVWILSAMLSMPGPLAYQVAQQVMYKRLGDERLAGIVLLTADKFVSIPFTQLYQIASSDWTISPFYVTLGLMISCTFFGLSTKTMRSWIRG
ncbi:ORF-22 [Agrotis segetum nucleopolyhedrovirus A]|uniref:ORF-22 n=1 Tax=Agrotis segetum nuclear polyhedrosis virus TaxID=1962501 RepID=Q287Q0_NPVAS|nr:ORF-22 [Agrotis segetum nucleopolyhedrovirus A]AAZ38188.1 ORF-22 [Agrotis segetum nucleopolyhedrovirus A]